MKQKKIYLNLNILLYTFCFMVIVIIGYFPLWKNGLSNIWNVDAIGQYYPAFLYIGQYIRRFFGDILNGSLSLPLYDLAIGMGEDIIGVLNYYGFGDPLNLLAVFATVDNGVWWYMISFFLRIWLAGIMFQAYCKEVKMNSYAAIPASLAYSFCGFAIWGGGRYIEWLSVLIYFPLMLLGTERILKKNYYSLMLVLAVAYGGLCGFYYLYMSSLCLGIYWIVRLIAFNGMKNVRNLIINGLHLVKNYVLGLFLAAPIFLPALSAYFNSERSEASVGSILFNIQNYKPMFNEGFYFALLDFFHYCVSEFNGVLFVELLALVIVCFIHGKKALQLKTALCIAFCAFHIPITGWVFNGFGETNDRWVFWIYFLSALVLAYVLTVFLDVKISIDSKEIQIINKKLGYVLICLWIIANIVINIRYLYSAEGRGNGWNSEMVPIVSVETYVDSPVNYSEIVLGDDEVYRVTNTILTNINGRPENIAMLNDYYGATWWYSIINADTQMGVNNLLQKFIGWRSFGFDNNPIYETFAGVKYYFSRRTEETNSNYDLLEQIEFNNEVWNVYENPNYFGMAYTRDKEFSDTLWNTKTSYESFYEKIYELFIRDQEKIEVNYERAKDKFSLRVNSESTDEVIILVPYHKNWKAYVDGTEVGIQKADMMYMAIVPGAGEHEIVLKYHSEEFKVGMILAMLSMLVIVENRWNIIIRMIFNKSVVNREV